MADSDNIAFGRTDGGPLSQSCPVWIILKGLCCFLLDDGVNSWSLLVVCVAPMYLFEFLLPPWNNWTKLYSFKSLDYLRLNKFIPSTIPSTLNLVYCTEVSLETLLMYVFVFVLGYWSAGVSVWVGISASFCT